MIGLSTAMIIENPFVAIGIGTYCAGATFLGSLTMEEIPSADSKENEDFLNLVIKNCFSNGFSRISSDREHHIPGIYAHPDPSEKSRCPGTRDTLKHAGGRGHG